MTTLTMTRGKGGRWAKGAVSADTTPSVMATREQWLGSALALIRQHLHTMAAVTVPDTAKVSCGLAGGRIGAKRIGECWSVASSADGYTEIFISPVLSDVVGPAGVLATLVHEAIHAAVGVEHGHKKAFSIPAKAAGLEGKMTATFAGTALLVSIKSWSEALGAYPHAAMSASGRKKQSTRLVKVSCKACGYTLRTTQKWLDLGIPSCYCNGEEMRGEAQEDDGDSE